MIDLKNYKQTFMSMDFFPQIYHVFFNYNFLN